MSFRTHPPSWLGALVVAVAACSALACASVPKEVVELSYAMGRDLDAIQLSYTELVRRHFAHLRTQTTQLLDTRWTPVFLKEFIQKGELLEAARRPDAKQALEDVQDWTEAAVEQIQAKKQELLGPIDAEEAALIATIDAAFANLVRSNATITAHLNSLREVQEVQDDALRTLQVRELRDKVNRALAAASERAGAALGKLEEGKQQ
jgi:hypothetical protein